MTATDDNRVLPCDVGEIRAEVLDSTELVLGAGECSRAGSQACPDLPAAAVHHVPIGALHGSTADIRLRFPRLCRSARGGIAGEFHNLPRIDVTECGRRNASRAGVPLLERDRHGVLRRIHSATLLPKAPHGAPSRHRIEGGLRPAL